MNVILHASVIPLARKAYANQTQNLNDYIATWSRRQAVTTQRSVLYHPVAHVSRFSKSGFLYFCKARITCRELKKRTRLALDDASVFISKSTTDL